MLLHSTEYKDFCKQYPECKIELKQNGKKYHDRYIVIDYGTKQEKIFHCGPSSKDGGMRIGSIVEIREREAYHTLVEEIFPNRSSLKTLLLSENFCGEVINVRRYNRTKV